MLATVMTVNNQIAGQVCRFATFTLNMGHWVSCKPAGWYHAAARRGGAGRRRPGIDPMTHRGPFIRRTQ